jgi:hypothetical protein
MKTGPQHLLAAHVPFYKRRLFWIIIFSTFFIFSTTLFINFLDKNGGNYSLTLDQKFDFFNIAFASTLFRFILYDIFGNTWQYIGSSIYFILIASLAYKTFQKPKVLLRYPIILSILYITGMIASVLLLGSLS